jgi:hypothetical protein
MKSNKSKTRKENFLAKIAGSADAKDMTPKTSEEYYLNEIAENGGGAGGGGEPFVVTFTDAPNGGDGEFVTDKTFAEILSAYNDGKTIVCTANVVPVNGGEAGRIVVYNQPMVACGDGSDGNVTQFSLSYALFNQIRLKAYLMSLFVSSSMAGGIASEVYSAM